MNLYAFSSKNLTNIWAGIGAGLWAISEEAASNVGGAAAKAKRLRVGAAGIIYCSKDQAFTTPFLVLSAPAENRMVDYVWPERWTLPFRIQPLGTPRALLPKDELASVLPSLRDGRPWNRLLHIEPTTVFVPSEITEADWEALFARLAAEASAALAIPT
jgi:hypothetical protein